MSLKMCHHSLKLYLLSTGILSPKSLFQLRQNFLNQRFHIRIELFNTSSPFGFRVRIIVQRMHWRESCEFFCHKFIGFFATHQRHQLFSGCTESQNLLINSLLISTNLINLSFSTHLLLPVSPWIRSIAPIKKLRLSKRGHWTVSIFDQSKYCTLFSIDHKIRSLVSNYCSLDYKEHSKNPSHPASIARIGRYY